MELKTKNVAFKLQQTTFVVTEYVCHDPSAVKALIHLPRGRGFTLLYNFMELHGG